MNLEKEQLPDDSEKLKEIILCIKNDYDSTKNDYEDQLRDERFKYEALHEKFLTLQRKFFGRKSEKVSVYEKEQMLLFNEAEAVLEDDDDKEDTNEEEITIIKEHTRKKKGRKKLPDSLPRETIIHDLSEAEKKCSCCGKDRPRIGEEVTEELDIKPAEIKVNKHVKLKYGPCNCDDFLETGLPEVATAPGPKRIIPYSIVSPGLLAYVLTSKYVDSLPFYRQSKMFQRIEADISRATLSNWAILAAEKCKPLLDIFLEDIRKGPFIQMDETTVQVLKEPGRDPSSKSYMWVTVGYLNNRPIVMYDYHEKRSRDIPASILDGYKGFLQTDGYAGYNYAVSQNDIVHVGCFAHSRRYFHDASKLSKKSNSAKHGLSYIKKLYKIEKRLRDSNLSNDNFLTKRKEEALPVLEEFHNWLIVKKQNVPPQSKLGEAIKYTLNEWEKLIRYLNAHFLTPDNNLVENAIRPFVIGRRNWLFSNTPRGAHASAVIYSLVETAKANNLDPYKYLRFLFTKLPNVDRKNKIRKLSPYFLSPDDISIND